MRNAERSRLSPTPKPEPLARGRFTDGSREFAVCATTAVETDSFQVYPSENRADLVLIVSGLRTGDLHATWGEEWRNRSPEWRDWLRTCAFHVFHNGTLMPEPQPARPARDRFCNG